MEGIGSTNSFNDSYSNYLDSYTHQNSHNWYSISSSSYSEIFRSNEYSNVSSYESVFGEAVGIDDSKIYLGKGKDDFNLEVLGGSNSSGLVSSKLKAGKGSDEINIFCGGNWQYQ